MLLSLGCVLVFVMADASAQNNYAPPGAIASADSRRIVFDHPTGFYEAPFRLILSTSNQPATIYYTTDGSSPHPANAIRYRQSIPISTTTVLRAAAFERETLVSEVATRSYLFARDILRQNGADFPASWGAYAGQPIPAHYAMSQASVADADSRKILIEALQALPSISVVTDPASLFSAESGIYLHPLERGADWERAVAVELFDPQGSTGFQINCGMRIHGGMSRRPEESPKHSFRLSFKRKYGAGKLQFPLFGSDGVQEFDDLVLKAGGSDSWLDSNGAQRQRAAYIRDEWMRRSMHDLDHPAARGRFVHLYLNGLYWGLYNLCERPGASQVAAEHPETGHGYDVQKTNELECGDRIVWDKLMSLANSGSSEDQTYAALRRHLHLEEFVDYLLLNFYAGNTDWDRSANWYAVRPRLPDGRFQFLVWDAERTFGEIDADTLRFDDDQSPMRLFHKLSEFEDFRSLFAKRAQRRLDVDGPLGPGPAAARFRKVADAVAPALAAEAARWGNYRAEVHQYKTGPFEPYTASGHWQAETNRILARYLPERREVLVNQLRERGLYRAEPATK